jgi:hypothetical protein
MRNLRDCFFPGREFDKECPECDAGAVTATLCPSILRYRLMELN